MCFNLTLKRSDLVGANEEGLKGFVSISGGGNTIFGGSFGNEFAQ